MTTSQPLRGAFGRAERVGPVRDGDARAARTPPAGAVEDLRRAIERYTRAEGPARTLEQQLAEAVAEAYVELGASRCAVAGLARPQGTIAWMVVRGAQLLSSAEELPELLASVAHAGDPGDTGPPLDLREDARWRQRGWDRAQVVVASGGARWVAVLTLPDPASPSEALGETVAAMASLALEHRAARVRADRESRQARADAVAAEREQLACDLHDTVGQALVAIRLIARAHEDRCGSDDEMARVLARIGELAGTGKTDLVEIARSLAFAPAGDGALVPSLRGFATSISTDSGIPIELVVEGRPRRVAPPTAQALFRVAREAVMNAWRHARCAHIELRVRFDDRQICVAVRDDGIGASVTTDTGTRLGLAGMRRAMADVGGNVDVFGSGDGTVVEARAPFAAAR